MATRLKTVKYAFATLNAYTDNNTTNLTQLTINLPENSKTFRSVVATITLDDSNTATGDTWTTKNFGLRLGAAAYTTVSNANTLTASGENISFRFSVDYTSHFTTNWTGTSMTCDFQLQINSATNNANFVNVSVTLDITYGYDDTSATHIKTVMIPLSTPTGQITTTATTYDTIPVLDTYLPEASKTFRNIHLVLQANTQNNTTSTNNTVTINVGSATVTTGTYTGSLATDRMCRYVWNLTSAYPSTAATQTFQLSSTVARFNHPQVWLVVTYEFSPSTSTSVMNSVMVPASIDSPLADTSTDSMGVKKDFWVEEPATITTNRIAFYAFWQIASVSTTLAMRIGSGSFVTYTDSIGTIGGSNCAMSSVLNNAPTLARGVNTLSFDFRRVDTTLANSFYDIGLSGFWLLNYTSGISSQGVGAHNHTVEFSVLQNGTGAAATNATTASTAPVIPETEYFINNIGSHLYLMTTTTTQPSSIALAAERLNSETDGPRWDRIYDAAFTIDPEVGAYIFYASEDSLFWKWPTTPDPELLNPETARRYRISSGGGTAWFGLNTLVTYHSIVKTISGTVSGYVDADGAGLTVRLFSLLPSGLILHVGTTTTTTGGTYTFTWYDDAHNSFAVVHEDATHVGSSALSTAV